MKEAFAYIIGLGAAVNLAGDSNCKFRLKFSCHV